MPDLIFGVQGQGWHPWELAARRAVSFLPSIKQPFIKATTHGANAWLTQAQPCWPQGNVAALPHPRDHGQTSEGGKSRAGGDIPSKNSTRKRNSQSGISPGGMWPLGTDPKLLPILLLLWSSSFSCRVPHGPGPETLSHHLFKHSHNQRDPLDGGLVSPHSVPAQ